jgi:16S rRNA (guanine966-N2)-methyltransferase
MSGLRVLDLFAGSGAVGLEARSRGASSVVLVEADRPTAAVIRANAKVLGFDQVEVVMSTAERWVENHAVPTHGRFDVVYVDPPYAMTSAALADLLERLAATGRLADHAVVVVERSRRGESWAWPLALEGVRDKRYGETMLFYGRVRDATASPEQTNPITS